MWSLKITVWLSPNAHDFLAMFLFSDMTLPLTRRKWHSNQGGHVSAFTALHNDEIIPRHPSSKVSAVNSRQFGWRNVNILHPIIPIWNHRVICASFLCCGPGTATENSVFRLKLRKIVFLLWLHIPCLLVASSHWRSFLCTGSINTIISHMLMHIPSFSINNVVTQFSQCR